MPEQRLDDCFARWDAQSLVIGNSGSELAVSLAGADVRHDRLLLGGRPWMSRQSTHSLGRLGGEPVCAVTSAGPVARAGLGVTLPMVGGLAVELRVYPGLPGFEQRFAGSVGSSVGAQAADGAAPSGIELAADARPEFVPLGVGSFVVPLLPAHVRLTQVILRDQSDVNAELCDQLSWLLHPNEYRKVLEGNLFVVEDVLTGASLVLLKLAPLPHARGVKEPGGDLRFDGTSAAIYEAAPPGGFTSNHPGHPWSYTVAACGRAYPWVVLGAEGGHWGVQKALQAYQAVLRPYVAGRDGLFLSNTWGDRSRDAALCHDFMLGEVEAAGRLGVDVVQVDDGWQRGTTSNSVNSAASGGVWEGYYRKDSEFWGVNPVRFPRGLEPVIAAARANGQRFGLWFSPDSSDDFGNWGRDVETLIDLHRTLGVDYFKFDGVRAQTAQAEANLSSLFDAVLERSKGKIAIDLDVTAQVRPGYFGAVGVGPVFVENRYSDFRRYWPHQTLRVLWKLAHWVTPHRLRMELLNPARNLDRYIGDPLAPATYPPEYLFAIAMLASPLGWFEVSRLPADFIARVAPLVDLWKKHRQSLHTGTVYPIGQAPDGTSWTGFVVDSPGGVHALAFRELCETSHAVLPVPSGLPRGGTMRVLAGEGNCAMTAGGLEVGIPRPQRFVWAVAGKGH